MNEPEQEPEEPTQPGRDFYKWQPPAVNLRPYRYQMPQKEPGRGSLALGVALGLGLHLIWFIFPIAFFFLGVAQIVYDLPLVITFLLRDEKRTVAGVGIAAGITLLLNGLFCGAVMANGGI
ncbi:MAG: hypothetical protein KDB82_01000 [Planctomycetes bacterium]|nr:hypothetical protein [Planctomycetota bacterium]